MLSALGEMESDVGVAALLRSSVAALEEERQQLFGMVERHEVGETLQALYAAGTGDHTPIVDLG